MEDKVSRQEIAGSDDIFRVSGPTHLTVIDWKNFHHRRSVAASLVQGAYILERDRQQHRQGPRARATPWWASFHFHLIRPLIDREDNSIFGAIHEFKPISFDCAQDAPRYVITFRGTIAKPDSLMRDLELDLRCISQRLHNTSRFQVAMQAVQEIVDGAGGRKLWLAGHSLGSAIALLAGKNMAKMGYPMESYLFNPPFPSAPIEKIENEKLKQGLRLTKSIVKAGLAVAISSDNQRAMQEDAFAVLSTWLPYLFVNPADYLCSEYIGYFNNRKKMEEIGAGEIGRLETQNSIVHLLLSAAGKKNLDPIHLIPSAYLAINYSDSNCFISAHAICQWWNPNSKVQVVKHTMKF